MRFVVRDPEATSSALALASAAVDSARRNMNTKRHDLHRYPSGSHEWRLAYTAERVAYRQFIAALDQKTRLEARLDPGETFEPAVSAGAIDDGSPF